MNTKICGACKIEKGFECFGKDKKTKTGYKWACHDCRKIESKQYRENNRERRSQTLKDYYENNKEKELLRFKKYREDNKEKRNETQNRSYHKNKDKTKERNKFRTQTDPVYKLTKVVRSRVTSYIKKNAIPKNHPTFELVGCTPQELKEHLEKQFKEGMTWDNHGKYGWHIDHIIPLSSATTEEELYKLCHFTNLQPLWAEENLSKGNRIL